MLVKTINLDCDCFENLASKQEIVINSIQEIDTNTQKIAFTRKDGSKGWAIETSKMYDTDAYASEIKIYDNEECY